MPKRLKFVVEQCVLFMVRRQTLQAQQFEIFESARHFRIESKLEASQVPNWDMKINSYVAIDCWKAVTSCVQVYSYVVQ